MGFFDLQSFQKDLLLAAVLMLLFDFVSVGVSKLLDPTMKDSVLLLVKEAARTLKN